MDCEETAPYRSYAHGLLIVMRICVLLSRAQALELHTQRHSLLLGISLLYLFYSKDKYLPFTYAKGSGSFLLPPKYLDNLNLAKKLRSPVCRTTFVSQRLEVISSKVSSIFTSSGRIMFPLPIGNIPPFWSWKYAFKWLESWISIGRISPES
jgi:hypothetical protein